MPKRTSPSVLSIVLFLLLIVAGGCSTKSNDAIPTNSNLNNNSTAESGSKAKSRQYSLELRNAVIACLKRKGFTGEVRGIGSIGMVGDLSLSEIVAVEIEPMFNNRLLIYIVAHHLEDKNGNFYLRAEILAGTDKYVVDLMKNQKPLYINDRDDDSDE